MPFLRKKKQDQQESNTSYLEQVVADSMAGGLETKVRSSEDNWFVDIAKQKMAYLAGDRQELSNVKPWLKYTMLAAEVVGYLALSTVPIVNTILISDLLTRGLNYVVSMPTKDPQPVGIFGVARSYINLYKHNKARAKSSEG